MAGNPDTNSDSNPGFFHRIVNLVVSVFSISDSDREDKQRLKVIADKLKNYSSYFRLKNQSALPVLAEWFYAIYKITGPAKSYLERCRKSELFRKDLVESYLPDEVKQLAAILSADNIELKSNSGLSVDKLEASVQSNIDEFIAGFDVIDKGKINKAYTDFDKLLDFCRFQFSFLLKKFDSHFPENNYHYKPDFSAVEVSSIVNELIEFIELFYGLSEDGEWNRILQLCREHQDKEIIPQASWEKLMKSRSKTFNSKWLIYMIQYVNKDLQWRPKTYEIHEDIVDEYRSKIIAKAELTIKMLTVQHENKLLQEFEKPVFNGSPIIHNIHYSNKNNAFFASKNISAYLHILPLEYMRTFNQTEFQKNIRVIVELFIQHGKWGSHQFTEAYMRFKGNLERIEKFDADLGPEGSMGKKIKLLVKQYLYQTSPVGALENTIQTVNDEARHIINNLLQGLEVLNEHIGKFRDELDTDITKAIKNWNELKLHDPESMSLTINDIHLKISALIKLINFCMKSKYSTMLRSSTDGDTAAEPAHNEQ